MKQVNSTIAISPETREELQAMGYPSERYEDTILRLMSHYKNCPFSKMQSAFREILGRIDSLEYPYPKMDETPEEYARRVLSILQVDSGYQIKHFPREKGESDKDYLLRLILREIGEYA